MREMVDNLIVFVPFGLLLNANFKQISLWQKLAYIFFFSFAVEAFQFIFAIGITDITDVIMNTYGGFLGLALYDLANKYVDSKKLDRWITIVCAISLVVFLLLRVFVFKVKY
jgi:glycopeptide antibiotics resistance protein